MTLLCHVVWQGLGGKCSPFDSVPLGEGNHEISGQFGLRFDLQYAFIGVQKGETKGHGQ